MNLQKFNPWNWFKHEEGNLLRSAQVPVKRNESGSGNYLPMMDLHREIDRLFDNVFTQFGVPSIGGGFGLQTNPVGNFFKPQVDICGSDEAYEVNLDVPGMKESDLSVEITGDTLTIKGEKSESNESKDKQYFCVERSYGVFQRTLALPEDANAQDIRASLTDGVLKLQIPRKQIAEKDVKRISIN